MKFARVERYEPITFTERKAAAFLKRQQRERDALPLFADLIAAEQSDWATEQERRLELASKSEQGMRDHAARVWRKARAAYFAMPAEQRAACLAEWNAWWGPKKAECFAYVVSKYSGEYEAKRAAYREEVRASNARIAAMAAARIAQQPAIAGL